MSSEAVQKNVRVSLTSEEWRLLRREAADRDISLTALINDELSTSALGLQSFHPPEKART